jgi:hypothetical protein
MSNIGPGLLTGPLRTGGLIRPAGPQTQIGSALQDTANATFQFTAQFQQRRNAREGREAYIAASSEANRLWATDYSARSGSNAVGVSREFSEAMSALREKFSSALTKPARDVFETEFDPYSARKVDQAVNYEWAQDHAAETALYEARVNNELANIASGLNDGQSLADFEERMRAIHAENPRGLKPEHLDLVVASDVSKGWATAIQLMAATPGGEDAATSLLSRAIAGDKMTDADLAASSKTVQDKVVRRDSSVVADQFADAWLVGQVTVPQVRREIFALFGPGDPRRDAAMKEFMARKNQLDEARTEGRQEEDAGLLELITNAVGSGDTTAALDFASQINDSKMRRETTNYVVSGRTPQTDWLQYYELKDIASTPSRRDEFLSLNVPSTWTFLAKTEYDEISDLQHRMRTDPRYMLAPDVIFRQIKSLSGDLNDDQQRLLAEQIQREVEAYREINGAVPSKEELGKMISAWRFTSGEYFFDEDNLEQLIEGDRIVIGNQAKLDQILQNPSYRSVYRPWYIANHPGTRADELTMAQEFLDWQTLNKPPLPPTPGDR